MRGRVQGEPSRRARWRARAGQWVVLSAAVAGLAVLPVAQALAHSSGHVGKPAPAARGFRVAALAPSRSRAYVTNTLSNTVSVIDTASNTVIATVAVGIDPNAVAVALAPKPAPTMLSVKPATEARTSASTLLISDLSATLTSKRHPLAGRTITFTNATATTTLCTATTNSRGTTTCTTTKTGTPQQISALANDLRVHGYLATFTGDTTHTGSHATATITQTSSTEPYTQTVRHELPMQTGATLAQTGAETAGLTRAALGLLGTGIVACVAGRKAGPRRH